MPPRLPPPPPATLVVEPADGLADGQQVTVTGTGFRPGSEVYVAQCTAEGRRFSRCSHLAGEGHVDATGVLTGTVEVRREIGYDDPIDCATVEGGCTLETGAAFDGARLAAVPITFDPAAPLAPPPAVEVAPTTGLSDGQEVAVTGSGFSPGTPVGVLECVASDADDRYLRGLRPVHRHGRRGRRHGGVSTPFVVRSALATYADGVLDCGTASDACAVVVVSLVDDRDRAGVPIAFGGGGGAAASSGANSGPPPPMGRRSPRSETSGSPTPTWAPPVGCCAMR